VNGRIDLWWGDPDLAVRYRPELLRAADKERAELPRSPRADRDWRVSRALLQQALASAAGEFPLSLSHSRGHALVAIAPLDWRVGADLEAVRPRDIGRLSPWCCSDDEQAALRRCDDEGQRQRLFYLLWTLKESFIKAAGLSFPQDMRSVGLTPDRRLRAPGPGWRAHAALVDDAWLASVVWRPTEGDASIAGASSRAVPTRDDGDLAVAPCWHIARGVRIPRIESLGSWS
jgi:4'-phosphopantetheinyl transferase